MTLHPQNSLSRLHFHYQLPLQFSALLCKKKLNCCLHFQLLSFCSFLSPLWSSVHPHPLSRSPVTSQLQIPVSAQSSSSGISQQPLTAHLALILTHALSLPPRTFVWISSSFTSHFFLVCFADSSSSPNLLILGWARPLILVLCSLSTHSQPHIPIWRQTTHKFRSPAQTCPLHSRLIYPMAYYWSSLLGCITYTPNSARWKLTP